MANRVKQGGVISAIFFSLYIDPLYVFTYIWIWLSYERSLHRYLYIRRNEEAYLNSHPLLWMDKVRHLGNIIDRDCNEVNDCTFKKSMFIGYVNKLRSSFGKMQPSVLANLFI